MSHITFLMKSIAHLHRLEPYHVRAAHCIQEKRCNAGCSGDYRKVSTGSEEARSEAKLGSLKAPEGEGDMAAHESSVDGSDSESDIARTR